MVFSLPKNVTRRNFDNAFLAFASIVGAKWASSAQEDRELYIDPYNPGDPTEFVGGGFVAPKSVEEVQEVVKVASKFGVPLWPVSTGKNLAYGGAAPVVPGTVVLDLKRMNRILEVNDELAYVVVEPGVSFFDLYRYLQENNHKLWMSVPGPGWGSIIGNGLERGIGYGYYSDHFTSSAGLEAVLPSGELIRTGMGAMTNSETGPLVVGGYGPSIEGLFALSNYGIVTRMARHLLPEPEYYMSCEVNCQFDKGLEKIVEKLRPFKMDETIRNPVVIMNLEMVASFFSVREQWYKGKGAIPDEILPEVQKKLNLGRWNASFALYGTETKVNDSWQRIQRAVKDIPGIELHARVYRAGDEIVHPRDQSQAGIPSLNEFGLVNWVGSGGHIDISPVGPMVNTHVRKINELVRNKIRRYGFDHLCGFYCEARVFRYVNTLIFNKGNPKEMKRVRELVSVLIQKLAEQGYGDNRVHIAYMNQTAQTYDFNNHAMLRFQQTIKDALDPQGIIAPGKSGIWPKHYR
ncbi:MAG: FAD-binding oxidoreductase [Pseudomonadales bacterium]|nr:FAD-binding oxidoreductase [Pseudomonadales bacterium]